MTKTPTDAGAEVIALAVRALRAYRGHALEGYIAMRDDIVAHYRKFGKEADATARRDADIERLTKERAEVDAAIDSLSAALAGDGWVKCSERLPPIGDDVLVVRRDGAVRFAFRAQRHEGDAVLYWRIHGAANGYLTPGAGTAGHDEITHWRPLPNPPAMDATREGA